MRLKSIKLAGFKSFVDATTVQFPTNLSAVVGPNGCGKSNVIDAVRWVMGESSAKNLRGESMTDVIFNGSSSRQPAGQASIELVFDNSDHTIQGEWNQFSEVAIKRKVTRDAQNTYYINGTKCRRKDITDIFLGTGLGPRSYAIIEQGMISRLIEAKPDELRIFIEEAAGISKYKERRRDTENRIRRTRENLERLTDIRDELGRQLERLARQAASAEKYRAWRKDERELKHKVIAHKWLQLDLSRSNYDQKIQNHECEIDRLKSNRMASSSKIDALKTLSEEQKSVFDEVQAKYFQMGAEIARLQQASQHAESRRREINEEINDLQRRILSASDRTHADKMRIDEARIALDDLIPALEAAEEDMRIAEAGVEQFLGEEQSLREQYNEFQRQQATREQRIESAQRQIFSLQQQVGQLEDQRERSQDELKSLNENVDQTAIEALRSESLEAAAVVDEARATIAELEQSSQSTEQALEIAKETRSTLTESRHSKRGRLQALETLLEQRSNDELRAFLEANGLDQCPKLNETLEVPREWQRVVSVLLSDWMNATVEDTLGREGVAGLTRIDTKAVNFPDNSLGAVVKGKAIPAVLGNYVISGSLDEALEKRHELSNHQSFITANGIEVGINFVRWVAAIDQVSELELIEERATLEKSLAELDADITQINGQIDELQREHTEQKQAFAQAKTVLDQSIGRAQATERDLAVAETAYQQSLAQIARVEEEISIASERLAQLEEDYEVALVHFDEVSEEDVSQELDDEWRRKLLEAEQRVARGRTQFQELQSKQTEMRMTRQRYDLDVESAEDALSRAEEITQQYHDRVELLNEQLLSLDMASSDAAPEMIEALASEHLLLEAEMTEAKIKAESVAEELRQLEGSRGDVEKLVELEREKLEQLRIERQTVYVKLGGLSEELKDAEVDLKELLESLPEDVDLESWEQELVRIGERIRRLGPINLAAIDEYEQESERKNYLDQQDSDLNEALETLESAIRKIDKETRQRFKHTFETVNDGLKRLFPKVFGGGEAWLELTGDDLLETGVSIMARPPGKKNSTIHLLSGGEKAMTAIALVFSIFQLNPAPFCMLDEVDAPLDDANVGRYARLVEEMSSNVQFIYITHNKIAMEMAHQLQGVTMHEPGVSRLVSVDVDEAVALAEAS